MRECVAAICDDEAGSLELVANSLESCFRQNGMELRLDRYTAPAKLFAAVERGRWYQVLFLDIDMPGMDGIDLGVKLRTVSEQSTIIYISNCEERVFEAFQAQPFGFVRKSSFLKDVQSVVKLYIDAQRNDQTRCLELKTADGLVRLSVSDIVYVECSRDYQFLHTKTGGQPVKCRISMAKLEKLLEDEGFLRIHQGYIVNYACIKRIGNECVELLNGEAVPLSRRKKKEVFTQYLRLSRKDGGIINL